MGLVFVFLFTICFVSFLSWWLTESEIKAEKTGNMFAGFIISTVVLSIVSIFVVADSYSTYIDLRKNLAVIEQYKETVELYAEKGVQEFRPGSASSNEFTDLKYNNYQTQIGKMIREMRDSIVKYNTLFTSKKVLNDSFMFSWYIYLPDDMKAIKMADYIN
jgi:hypothetical protein